MPVVIISAGFAFGMCGVVAGLLQGLPVWLSLLFYPLAGMAGALLMAAAIHLCRSRREAEGPEPGRLALAPVRRRR